MYQSPAELRGKQIRLLVVQIFFVGGRASWAIAALQNAINGDWSNQSNVSR
jgi:hypothetical protein